MWGIDTNEHMVRPRLRDIQKYGDLRLWVGRPATERDMSLLSFKTPWAWPPQGDLEPSCLSGNDYEKCGTHTSTYWAKENPCIVEHRMSTSNSPHTMLDATRYAGTLRASEGGMWPYT